MVFYRIGAGALVGFGLAVILPHQGYGMVKIKVFEPWQDYWDEKAELNEN